jgi:hypothetical protein
VSKRFLIVEFDSSIAMIPLPGATIAWAMLSSSSMLITGSAELAQKEKARRGRASATGP